MSRVGRHPLTQLMLLLLSLLHCSSYVLPRPAAIAPLHCRAAARTTSTPWLCAEKTTTPEMKRPPAAPRGRGGRGRGRGRGRGGEPPRASARRERLRGVCAAVRSRKWETVELTLEANWGEWSDGEWRAMLQAASQVTDWEGSLRLLARMDEAGRGCDVEAFRYAIAACSKANEPDAAAQLIDTLSRCGIVAPVRSHNQVISAWARCGKWEAAVKQLESTPTDIRTVVTYNAALSALSSGARWSEALDLLGRMERDGPAPDVVSYSTAAAACQKARRWEPALGLLQRLNASSTDDSEHGSKTNLPAPNVFTYTSAVVALAEAGKWRDAVRTFDAMPKHLERNEAIVNAAVSAASYGKDWRCAVRLLDEAVTGGTVPRASSFNMAFKALAEGRQPAAALALLRRMRQSGCRPNLLTMNAVLRALETAGRWRQAAKLLREMQVEKIKPNLISYNLAVGACAKGAKKDGVVVDRSATAHEYTAGGPAAKVSSVSEKVEVAPKSKQGKAVRNPYDNEALDKEEREAEEAEADPDAIDEEEVVFDTAGEQAVDLLLGMQRRGLKPDVVTYSSVIAALAAGGQYERVIGMLGAMRAAQLAPNAFSWTAAIAACERAGEWQKALGLFAGLREAGEAADLPTWQAAISAAGSSGDVELALSMLDEMRTEPGLNVTLRAYNGVLKACERSADHASALKLMMQLKSEGLKPDRISYTSALGAAGRAYEWEIALGLWQQMLAEGIPIDSLALHTLLRALTLAGQWEVSLFVFGRAIELAPKEALTSKTFAAAFEACAAGAQRDRALELLQSMPQRGVFPSAACYHGACAACAAAEDTQSAMAALQDMLRQDMRPLPETWQVVFEACRAAGREEEAAQVAEYAEQEGVPLLATADSAGS